MSCLPWPSEEKFLEKVLRDCEDELAFSLCRLDPVELCQKFFERSVISRESYDQFTSMDHNRIKSRLQVRYLVRLVSEKINKDPALWENLIAVLDTLEGVPSSLTDQLKQAVLSRNEGLADASEAVGGVSGPSMGEASENQDVVLTSRDVNILTELLAEVRDKWYEIAISFGLPQPDIEDCEGKNSKISLFQILSFWIANDSNPTLKKLTDTLCSNIVARTTVADKIKKNFVELSKSSKKNKHAAKSKSCTPKSDHTPTTPRIVSQSLPTEVADGKSTLLQVQASPKEPVSYQWKKDGQPLANSSRYNGVDEDILVVRHACQGTEGEYTCQVSLQDKQVSSEPITLTINFPLAKKHLLNLYSTVSEVPTPKGSWPPVVAISFINLALIKSSRAQKMTGDYSVRGDADDIIAVKENITYSDAFSEYKSGKFILVEGRPGSGKTTLGHKIIKDWKLGEVLNKSELTFLVTLRLLNNEGQDASLASILQEFYSNDDELAAVVSNIEKKDGEGVCFVLDGLDEYCFLNNDKSVIPKLLDRKLLPRSMIIVFSRLSAIESVKKDIISKRIEVFGFKKEQISEYVENFPFEDEEENGTSDVSITRVSQLKKYLHSHPNIHDMCYLPIHAAMICFLYQLSKNLSPTQTKMYEEFTISIIHRHLARQEDCQKLESLKDLKGIHAQYFQDLCHLAYEMTRNSKQVISSQGLKDGLGGRGSFSEEAGLGLLTICLTLQKTGIHQNYAFLHLTFQEFLAAYYIANYLDDSKQCWLIEERFRYHIMRTVWRFYCGLVNCEHSNRKLHGLLSLRVRHELFEFFYYALESQQKHFCDEVIECKSHRLVFRGSVTPTDLTAVHYVITSSSQPITRLEIEAVDSDTVTNILYKLKKADLHQLCHISIDKLSVTYWKGIAYNTLCNDEGTEHFCELLKKSMNVETLHLSTEHKLQSSAASLASQINHCTKLLLLTINYRGTPECIQTFVGSLCPHIPECTLSFNNLNAECFQALGSGLQYFHSNCLHLRVLNSDISEDSMTVLLESLQKIKALHLKLSGNRIDCNGLNCLSRKMNGMPLQSLDLSQNGIGPGGVAALTQGLTCVKELKKLNITRNNICCEGAVSLAGGLSCLIGLEELDLSCNKIGPDGADALANSLTFVTALQKLDISHNNIGPGGAIALAGGLRCLTELRNCDMQNNGIELEGARAVITSLEESGAVRELGLLSHKNAIKHVRFAEVDELKRAAQHKSKRRILHLGYRSYILPPKNVSDNVPSHTLKPDHHTATSQETLHQRLKQVFDPHNQ